MYVILSSVKYRRMDHAVFYCDYHLVWPTKFRRKVLNPGVREFLLVWFQELAENRPDIIVKTVNIDQDHIHIHVSIPPSLSVGSVVRLIKSNSARALNQKFPHLRTAYWGTRSVWSAGYFCSTIGANESTIRQYIENQGKEEAGQNNAKLF